MTDIEQIIEEIFTTEHVIPLGRANQMLAKLAQEVGRLKGERDEAVRCALAMHQETFCYKGPACGFWEWMRKMNASD